MKIFFFPKQLIQLILVLLLCLLAAGAVWSFLGFGESDMRAEMTIAEPIYCGSTDKQQVAIAINVDWGEDVIPQMLEVLEEQKTKATFFITGRFAEKFPDIVTQIAEAGHEIGNHGYAHPHPDQLSVAENQADIVKAEEILEPLIGVKPVLYAPPYGECGENCLTATEQCGYTTIMWTADTIDWEEPAPSREILVARVTGDKLQKGAILLMHPKTHTAEALQDIIMAIGERGYTCVTVSEVL